MMDVMNVSLTPELERFVHEKVETGRYQTSSEVVRDALRLLQSRDAAYEARFADLRGELITAVESAKKGRVMKIDPQQFKARMRKRVSAMKRKSVSG